MSAHGPGNVVAAYEMLLEELEQEIDRLNQAGGRAFAAGEHARAQDLLARVWCRYTLREEGLLKADSPHGLWEISDKGREWLATQG